MEGHIPDYEFKYSATRLLVKGFFALVIAIPVGSIFVLLGESLPIAVNVLLLLITVLCASYFIVNLWTAFRHNGVFLQIYDDGIRHLYFDKHLWSYNKIILWEEIKDFECGKCFIVVILNEKSEKLDDTYKKYFILIDDIEMDIQEILKILKAYIKT